MWGVPGSPGNGKIVTRPAQRTLDLSGKNTNRNLLERLDFSYEDTERLDLGATDLYWELRGETGPGLTVINNWLMVAPSWRTLTRKLERTARILTYDLRNRAHLPERHRIRPGKTTSATSRRSSPVLACPRPICWGARRRPASAETSPCATQAP